MWRSSEGLGRFLGDFWEIFEGFFLFFGDFWEIQPHQAISDAAAGPETFLMPLMTGAMMMELVSDWYLPSGAINENPGIGFRILLILPVSRCVPSS